MRLIRADSDPREADPELSNRAAEAERVSDELSQLPARLRPAEGGGRASESDTILSEHAPPADTLPDPRARAATPPPLAPEPAPASAVPEPARAAAPEPAPAAADPDVSRPAPEPAPVSPVPAPARAATPAPAPAPASPVPAPG